jgi:hypothetical protein
MRRGEYLQVNGSSREDQPPGSIMAMLAAAKEASPTSSSLLPHLSVSRDICCLYVCVIRSGSEKIFAGRLIKKASNLVKES